MCLFLFSAVTRLAEDLEDTSTSGSSYKDAAVQTGNASNATTPTYTAAVGDRMSASICTEPLKKICFHVCEIEMFQCSIKVE